MALAPVSWLSLNLRHRVIYEGSSLYLLIISFVQTNAGTSWFTSTEEGRRGEELISISQYRDIRWTLGCVQSKQDLFFLLVILSVSTLRWWWAMAMNLKDEHKEREKPFFQTNHALLTRCSTKQVWKSFLFSFCFVVNNKAPTSYAPIWNWVEASQSSYEKVDTGCTTEFLFLQEWGARRENEPLSCKNSWVHDFVTNGSWLEAGWTPGIIHRDSDGGFSAEFSQLGNTSWSAAEGSLLTVDYVLMGEEEKWSTRKRASIPL